MKGIVFTEFVEMVEDRFGLEVAEQMIEDAHLANRGANANSAFTFLSGIETHIHSEVRKLYPEAELPTFECKLLSPSRMEMLYCSARPFGDLAEGMIRGCIHHFGEQIDIHRENLAATSGTSVRFTLSKRVA